MIFFLMLLYLLPSKANYCSCIEPSPIDDRQYNEYGLIAKGKIVKVTMDAFSESIYLSVDTCFKGGATQKTIEITSPASEGMCGIFPQAGEHWLIFAYADGKHYRTNLCTRTKNMNPKSWNYQEETLADDLRFLRARLKQGNH